MQFQPSDWFKFLRPNLSPKDLTMAAESLAAEYRAKKQRLRSLKAQLAGQTAIEISPDEQEGLKTEIESWQQQLSRSQQALIAQYGSGALSAVKVVISIYKNELHPYAKAQEVVDKVRDAKNIQKLDVTEKRIYDILENISDEAVKEVHPVLSGAGHGAVGNKSVQRGPHGIHGGKARDMTLQKQHIEEEIQTIQADLNLLTPLITGTIAGDQCRGRGGRRCRLADRLG